MKSPTFTLITLVMMGCMQPTQKVIEKYPNGQNMIQYFYPDKSDSSSYICLVYYESGRIKHETQVASNRFVGEKKSFFENGNLERTEKLSHPTAVDSKLYDCYITNFRPDGSKESEYEYINNEINGLAIDYDSAGRKARTAEYKNGKINGRETLYYESGREKSVAFVENDTLKGFNIYFNETGDTLKWFHNGTNGINGIFYKKWLNNGLILTGNYGDSQRSYVVWNWLDKANRLIKTKIAKSDSEKYIAPE